MDTANWMRDIWDQIKRREIWRVLLPGSHDSGAFSWMNATPVRTQDKNIQEQLEGGIRVFDIRVTEAIPSVFVMHHGGFYPWIIVDRSQFLNTALEQMKSFASEHDHEIFVVRLSPGDKSTLDNSLSHPWQPVRQMILDYLEDYLLPWNTSYSYTLEDIKARNKSIILLSAMGKEEGKEDLFWDSGTEFCRDTWDGHQDDPLVTMPEKFAWLKPHIEQALKTPALRFLNVAFNMWSLDICLTAQQNWDYASWIVEWTGNPEINSAMNIFSVDFFENGGIVETLAKLNSNLDPSNIVVLKSSSPKITADESGKSLKEALDIASASNNNFFNEANIKKTLSVLGLDWGRYKSEYEKTGSLGEESLIELEKKNIPKFVMPEFLKWYTSKENN